MSTRSAVIYCLRQQMDMSRYREVLVECERRGAADQAALLDEDFLELWMRAAYRCGQPTRAAEIARRALDAATSLGKPTAFGVKRLAERVSSEEAETGQKNSRRAESEPGITFNFYNEGATIGMHIGQHVGSINYHESSQEFGPDADDEGLASEGDDPTAADVSQGGGPRVREESPQSMPGQATPEGGPARTAPGGPDIPAGPAEPDALPAPEQRFLQGKFPERIRLGEEVSLLARLGLHPGGRLEAALQPLRVPEAGLEVVLLLVDSPGFALRSPERTVVRVIPRQDSDWASFELQATRPGVHTLQVEAFVGGTGLGGLSIQVSVDAAAQTGPLMERRGPAVVVAGDPAEISLLLSYDADQHVYRYRLVDSGGYYSEEAASDRLLQPPGQAVEQLVAQLNALARGQEAWDAATTQDWLKGQGITLWNSFIPQTLQREFWQRRDRITQMTIISQGDPVPWELLYPFAPGGQEAGFLVDQFPVARRRYGPRPPGLLELGAANLVLSRDGTLAAAPAEIAVLEELFRNQGLAARHIDDLPSLLQAFRQGDVGLLHFSCHNAFVRGAPNASRILLRDQPFEPVFLEEHAGRFAAPLVFLNACRTDGQAPLYTTVEGWASSFLRAGAGAFIGSLWEVSDLSASIYAQAFYQAALSGHTLGGSASRARDAIRDNPGDPTWLAYALYGDPAATIRTRAD